MVSPLVVKVRVLNAISSRLQLVQVEVGRVGRVRTEPLAFVGPIPAWCLVVQRVSEGLAAARSGPGRGREGREVDGRGPGPRGYLHVLLPACRSVASLVGRSLAATAAAVTAAAASVVTRGRSGAS